MFKFLFGGVSLKGLVMKRINAKIADYQERLDDNLADMKFNKKNALVEAWDNYIAKRKQIVTDYKYNEEKIIDTHVTNLLNKIL